MSTLYRIAGRGCRLTKARIRMLVEDNGGTVVRDHEDEHLIIKLGSGYVHAYQTHDTAWNSFIRFGDNYAAADEWVGILEGAGIAVLSEHDKGFY